MNFLAHAFLAGDVPALVVGGVAGDWIKGPLPGRLPPDLARGVALHRAIDSHADSHPAFRRSRARCSPACRRYAGVLVDIFYDHLLARDWSQHHRLSLADYAAGVHRQIARRINELPASAAEPLARMAREGWLESYAGLPGIADVLERMSRRAQQRSGRGNPLAGGEREFLSDPSGFAADFHEWLVDARIFARHAAASALPQAGDTGDFSARPT